MDTNTHNRYSRQVLFDPIGAAGQERLSAATAVVVGCGGLGTVSADILVRAGVGTVRIIDRDIVDESNLQRQMLYDSADVAEGLPKAEAACRKLAAINPLVTIEGLVQDFDSTNAIEVASGADVLVDATDNLEARYLLNDVAVLLDIPWVYGAAVGSAGMAAAIVPRKTPCLRCLYEDQGPAGTADTCDTAGILASTTHAVAARQCALALTILVGGAVASAWLQLDVWEGRFKSFSTSGGRNPDCPCCVRREFTWLNAARGSYASTMCGREAVQISWKDMQTVDFEALAERLTGVGDVAVSRFTLRLDVDDVSMTVFRDGRAIIDGVADPARARELYARYIG